MSKKREPISKKLRFEIFKRDKFQCQYCGKVAPDVILEVDHIKPVVDGGDNNIMNLVTSCFDCNRGKGQRKLSDSETLKKSYREIKRLSDRKEQLEMMMQWRNISLTKTEDEFDYLCDLFLQQYDIDIVEYYTEKTIGQIKRSIKKYGLDLFEKMAEKTASYHETKYNTILEADFISDIRKKCFFETSKEENPDVKIKYISGILSNRTGVYKGQIYKNLLFIVDKLELNNDGLNNMEDYSKTVDDYNIFLNHYGFSIKGEEE